MNARVSIDITSRGARIAVASLDVANRGARIAVATLLSAVLLATCEQNPPAGGGSDSIPSPGGAGEAGSRASAYRARLSPLPVTLITVSTITGGGYVQGTLDGNRLALQGAFEGMSSPATAAHIHQGPMGRPGPVIQPLAVDPSPDGTDGTVSGTIELTDDQLTALRGGSLYVQVHSTENPGGELRGWIFGGEFAERSGESLDFAPPAEPHPLDDFVPVTDAMLRDPDPADWLMIRGNSYGQSYSRLDQIDRGNVGELQLKWVWNMRDGSSEPAPLAYDGVVYLINPGNVVQALDGRTGELLWEHQTGPDDGQDMRNIAIYGDKIIQATTDARLVALDRKSVV